MKIGICIITYNRIDALKRLLRSLEKAFYDEAVTLVISVDKSNADVIENYADNYDWKHGEKRVIKHQQNLGLRKHVLSCGNLLDEFDALIVLEDDISVAPGFYRFARQCAEKYSGDERIAGISLYSFPVNYQTLLPFLPTQSDSDVYLMSCAQSWGQVWMRKQWADFKDWYERNNAEFSDMPHLPHAICSWTPSSWLKYHTRYCIETKKYFVFPYISQTTNNADAGTHGKVSHTYFQANMQSELKESFKLNPTIAYDGFFEPLFLNLPEDTCIDFNGEKNNRQGQRYWLTTKRMDYRIVDSYALELKPWEQNVIQQRKGNDLFLYDTTIAEKNPHRKNDTGYMEYMLGYEFGIRCLVKMLIAKLAAKIK